MRLVAGAVRQCQEEQRAESSTYRVVDGAAMSTNRREWEARTWGPERHRGGDVERGTIEERGASGSAWEQEMMMMMMRW
jgi:hypothetical protein